MFIFKKYFCHMLYVLMINFKTKINHKIKENLVLKQTKSPEDLQLKQNTQHVSLNVRKYIINVNNNINI